MATNLDLRRADLDKQYPFTPPVSDPYADCQKWGSVIAIAICSIAALGAIFLIVAHNGYNMGPFSDLASVIEQRWACLTLAFASTGLALGFYGLLTLNSSPEESPKPEAPKKPIIPPSVPNSAPGTAPIPVTHIPPTETATLTPRIPEKKGRTILENSNLEPDDLDPKGQLTALLTDLD